MPEFSDRRVVRTTWAFYESLDGPGGLPPERGPNGEPSAHDFLVLDMPDIIERFATDFDELPRDPDDPVCAILIAAGRLVPTYMVTAQLADDGAVELIALDLDVDRPWEDDG